MIVIPKAGRVEHIQQNWRALDLHLTPEDLSRLSTLFAPRVRVAYSNKLRRFRAGWAALSQAFTTVFNQ